MAYRDYIVDPEALARLLAERGLRSVSRLCRGTGLPRSSLSQYVPGGRSALAGVFRELCRALDADPLQLLRERRERPEADRGLRALKACLSPLAAAHPQVAFVLLGSRARGRARRYSDYDVGLTAGAGGLDSGAYLALKGAIQDGLEDFPFAFDVFNLDRAPADFLAGIRYEPRLIEGSRASYHHFLGVLHGIRRSAEAAQGRAPA